MTTNVTQPNDAGPASVDGLTSARRCRPGDRRPLARDRAARDLFDAERRRFAAVA